MGQSSISNVVFSSDNNNKIQHLYSAIFTERSMALYLVSSTGTHQGTVLAPFLFTLYTSDCRSHSSKCPLIKFADDTALIGLISKDDESSR